MAVRFFVFLIVVVVAVWLVASRLSAPDADPTAIESSTSSADSNDYVGSSTCRECHERFYELWAPSHHGLAMQPYTNELAASELTAHTEDIKIAEYSYRAHVDPNTGYMLERGPNGEKKYPLVHAMGGRNIYYFLTPTHKGRLQTMPLAYDVNRKQWYDTADSAVRHFPGGMPDEPIHWTDSMYTFNTSCYDCHVSQLATNYDPRTDSYNTKWAEPGINCETCHGPAQEHVKVCQEAPEGEIPEDIKIIVTAKFTADQTNSMCAPCHAKMNPVSSSFTPGGRYYDHFGLTVLDHADFYPDGRDLGENYTFTTWSMSPCGKSGKLDCSHCHTSSGRYRFADKSKANEACLPCHEQRVKNSTQHTRHEAGTEGDTCIFCHMPTTEFARMTRSDHSMRPPTPATTIKYESPNACNLCHDDKDAKWSDDYVRQWHTDDYQKPVLELADLICQARRTNWAQLDEMLAYISSSDNDEVFAASLIRLLRNCQYQKKWPTIIRALEKDPSPLVRGSAAQALDDHITAESMQPLLRATADEYRLVRVNAAASLASIMPEQVDPPHDQHLKAATAEYIDAMRSREDDYVSHYNLGNFHMARQNGRAARDAFETAIRLRPDFIPPHINVAFVYNALGQNDKAEAAFNKAVELDPNNLPAHLNLGMLLGEMNRPRDAENTFRKALEVDPNSATAAYNLGVLIASEKPDESLKWCRKACELQPDNPRYGYTYAFYLCRTGKTQQGVTILRAMVDQKAAHLDAYMLLGATLEQQGKSDEAAEVYRRGSQNEYLSPQDKQILAVKFQQLSQ